MLLVSKDRGQKLHDDCGVDSIPGASITDEEAKRMLRMHQKRLELAERKLDSGIKAQAEPSHVFFNACVLENIGSWKYVAVGFGLAVKTGTSHRPPSAEEESEFSADPLSIDLVQTAIIGECDKDGTFIFKAGTSYQAYDFAGTCCNGVSDKNACILGHFRVE